MPHAALNWYGRTAPMREVRGVTLLAVSCLRSDVADHMAGGHRDLGPGWVDDRERLVGRDLEDLTYLEAPTCPLGMGALKIVNHQVERCLKCRITLEHDEVGATP